MARQAAARNHRPTIEPEAQRATRPDADCRRAQRIGGQSQITWVRAVRHSARPASCCATAIEERRTPDAKRGRGNVDPALKGQLSWGFAGFAGETLRHAGLSRSRKGQAEGLWFFRHERTGRLAVDAVESADGAVRPRSAERRSARRTHISRHDRGQVCLPPRPTASSKHPLRSGGAHDVRCCGWRSCVRRAKEAVAANGCVAGPETAGAIREV